MHTTVSSKIVLRAYTLSYRIIAVASNLLIILLITEHWTIFLFIQFNLKIIFQILIILIIR